MKKENAHLFLPLVQALANGKTIQIETYGSGELGWDSFEDDEEIRFCEDPEKYRIRPEPRTWNIYVNETTSVVADGDDHQLVKNSVYDWEHITVQEVMK